MAGRPVMGIRLDLGAREDAVQGACFHIPAASLRAVEDPATCGLVTAADFAEAVGCSLRATQKWCANGRVEGAFKPSWCGVWLLPVAEVARISEELEVLRRGD